MQSLTGKVALVTGGSRGIGAACVRQLAAAGATVAFTYETNRARAEALAETLAAEGVRCLPIQADSADPEAVQAAVAQAAEAFGRLDILVNNAGIFPNGPPEEVTLADLERTLAIHCKAVFLASQAALKRMGEGGRIVSIGSCFAQAVPAPGLTLYAMSKSALIGFTKGLARDLGRRGITVNAVDPGPTDTDMNPADANHAAAEAEQTAIGRYGRPEEVAATVRFLAGAEAANITGATIAVDGGTNA
jgi:3-oxoacyl-[acyl-carrier protein] reductase